MLPRICPSWVQNFTACKTSITEIQIFTRCWWHSLHNGEKSFMKTVCAAEKLTNSKPMGITVIWKVFVFAAHLFVSEILSVNLEHNIWKSRKTTCRAGKKLKTTVDKRTRKTYTKLNEVHALSQRRHFSAVLAAASWLFGCLFYRFHFFPHSSVHSITISHMPDSVLNRNEN